MIRSGFNMKRDITPFSPHAASRNVIPATIISSAKRIDIFPDLLAARELENHRSIPFSTWQSPFSKVGSLRAADLNPWRPVVPPRRHYCRGCDDACAYFNSKWE